MTEEKDERSSSTIEEKDKSNEKKEEKKVDPEIFSCLLQPPNSSGDPQYIGIRRLLLHHKAELGLVRRSDWRCNGRGYVAYRNYICRPKNWESLHMLPSHTSTPGNSGRWVPSRASHLFEVESLGSSRDLRTNLGSSRRDSFSSTISDNDHPRRLEPEPAYSFVGMQCIFDQCKAAVTVIKFGHMSSDLLAYGASDGTLAVCTVSDPPSVVTQLRGHSKDVTAEPVYIVESPNDKHFHVLLPYNTGMVMWLREEKVLILGKADETGCSKLLMKRYAPYIASSSLDKTVRVWEIPKGLCIRVIYGVSPQLCIRFHPVNNNFLSVGNANKEITVLNFSTGRIISKITFDDAITAMDHDHTGQLIFCGDAQGCVYSVSMDSRTGVLSRSHRNRSSNKHKSVVTTVQYRSFSLLARGPVLLTCTQDGNLSFFSVALEIQGYLTIRCSLKLAPRLNSIRASFCPLLSLEKGEYIVAGSEDSNVYFYDLTRPKHSCVNKLQGHGFPVIGVAWNHGENLLASSDLYGVVIVWKRAKAT